jgi:glycosyltransferase involved in cell wall biosynthesis
MNLPVSLVMVCYNEERFLTESLARLSFCAERMVIDLGSSDGSVQAARRAGAEVLFHPHVEIVEQVQNFGIARARHDWVLLADPDLYFDESSAAAIGKVISGRADERIGSIYLPILTCVAGTPLRFGSKGGVRSYRALINRTEFEQVGLLHHRGKSIHPGARNLYLGEADCGPIRHYWIDRIGDVFPKARRYLRHEGESRCALGQRFSWRGAWLEVLRTLKREFLDYQAWRERPAAQVALFQAWYNWRANLALREYCRQLAADPAAAPPPSGGDR